MSEYKGKWALVTGASAGIGAAFARSLAGRGANIILVARREDAMNALAETLRASFHVEAKVISADLADPAAPHMIYETLKSDGTPVDILINNAGYGLPGYFLTSDWPAHRDFLNVMVASYVELSHLFLPEMVARGFGRVIQVASMAGLVPGSAGHTLYGASKAFLVSFAQSLAAEYEEAGVKVSALCPGFTYSEFHDVNNTRDLVSKMPKYMFMDAAPVVEGALAAVERGHVVYVPGGLNKSIIGLVKLLPRSWGAAMMLRQSKQFRSAEGMAHDNVT